MKAMIFAAGFGTRLKPLTDSKPKALVEISGKPLLELVIEKLVENNFNQIIVNVHHHADQVVGYLTRNKFDAEIHISHEHNVIMETGGGLKHAQWFFNDGNPFLIHNVDIISEINLNDLYESHSRGGSVATLAVKDRDSSRCFLFDENEYLCGWRNRKTGAENISRETKIKTELAFSGIQVVDPVIFKYFPWREVFSIVDLYLEAAKSERIKAYRHDDVFWQDVGRIEDLTRLKNDK